MLRITQLADLELAYSTCTAIVGIAAWQIIRELDPPPAEGEGDPGSSLS